MRSESAKRRAFVVAALVTGTLAGLVVADVAVRLVFADEFSRVMAYPADEFEPSNVAGIPLLFRPGVPGITNGQGLRTPHDVATPKPAGVVRVLVIGDSTTGSVAAAPDLSSERLYTALLERALARPFGPRVEVLNLSMPGLSMRQEVTLLVERGLAFEPDVVLLVYCINDPIETDIAASPNVRLTPWAFLNLFRLRAYRDSRSLAQAIEDHPDLAYRDDAPPFRDLRRVFQELAAVAAGRRVAVVPLPVLEALPEAQPHLAPVARLAAEVGLPVIDVYRELADRLLSFREGADNVHFNEAGHAALAAVLARRLEPVVTKGAWPP